MSEDNKKIHERKGLLNIDGTPLPIDLNTQEPLHRLIEYTRRFAEVHALFKEADVRTYGRKAVIELHEDKLRKLLELLDEPVEL